MNLSAVSHLLVRSAGGPGDFKLHDDEYVSDPCITQRSVGAFGGLVFLSSQHLSGVAGRPLESGAASHDPSPNGSGQTAVGKGSMPRPLAAPRRGAPLLH